MRAAVVAVHRHVEAGRHRDGGHVDVDVLVVDEDERVRVVNALRRQAVLRDVARHVAEVARRDARVYERALYLAHGHLPHEELFGARALALAQPVLLVELVEDGAALRQRLHATDAALDVRLRGEAAVLEATQQVLEALELAELLVERGLLHAQALVERQDVLVGQDVLDLLESKSQALQQLDGVERLALLERVVAIARLVVARGGREQALLVVDAQRARGDAVEPRHSPHGEPVRAHVPGVCHDALPLAAPPAPLFPRENHSAFVGRAQAVGAMRGRVFACATAASAARLGGVVTGGWRFSGSGGFPA